MTLDVEPGLRVVGDEDRLRAGAGDVVANALSHTPTGSPLSLCARRDDDGAVIIEVADDGPGMASDVIDKVTNVSTGPIRRGPGPAAVPAWGWPSSRPSSTPTVVTCRWDPMSSPGPRSASHCRGAPGRVDAVNVRTEAATVRSVMLVVMAIVVATLSAGLAVAATMLAAASGRP